MKRSSARLTPKIQASICSFILSGGYPHVAAEAAGIPAELFEHWLSQARAPNALPRYVRFRRAVMKACAQARLAAEARALNKDALSWLKFGPGKECSRKPGWSNPVRPVPRPSRPPSVLLDPATQQLLSTLLQLLTPYPEARAAVASALREKQIGDLPQPPSPRLD